jgi:saccharopine dehydrogenase-like NADP-dependent oxidoreductase
MKNIFIIGAGRSTSVLIQYLLSKAKKYDWEITIGDREQQPFRDEVPWIRQVILDVFNEQKLDEEVARADIVISMLPAMFHPVVARICLKYSRSLLTASYVSPELSEMEVKVKSQGILFLNELGVDPGIDHMSAMQVINRMRAEGHEILCFETFTGGLIAPESDTGNPWHYKFTWNPRNVVLAGQGGPARFIQEGTFKFIPYHRLFRRTELIEIEGYGKFEGYANRDSIRYIDKYHLQDVPTVYRGTLRRPGYCRAWDVFVQLGATDDSYTLSGTETMTYKEFINSFLYYSNEDPVKTKLYQYMHIDQDSDVREKLEWLNIFSDSVIGIKNATPARILEHILSRKWTLEPNDKDMLVMWHKFIYRHKESGQKMLMTSSLVVIGDDRINTAMAKTVGLPMGIAAKMVLTGQIKLNGVHIPTIKDIYEPILAELREYDIRFKETIGYLPENIRK